jgi:hypothetical protein
MNSSRRSFLILFLLGLVGSLAAMDNSDIIKMTRADFSERTILMAIEKEPADYDTSPDALIELKQAGVTETVIQKIVSLRRGERDQRDKENASEVASGSSRWAGQDFSSIAPPTIEPAAGKEYFLRSTLHFEDGEHLGTNYARGTVVAINTPVKIEAIRGNSISLHRIDTGDKLEIVNVEKYTRKSIVELAKLIFAVEDTPLEDLPADLAAAIRAGEMRKGMTKEHVLMARGYPPGHETPSIESDRWVYWSSRFVRHTITFRDGRLFEGRGIN